MPNEETAAVPIQDATTEQKKTLLLQIFNKSSTHNNITDSAFQHLNVEEINALYNICTAELVPGTVINDVILDDLSQRIDKISKAAKIVFSIKNGNPYIKLLREFLDAVKCIENSRDSAVRLGATLEALGALAEGLGKLIKKTGQWIQKHPKMFASIATVIGISVPVLWPASAVVVSGIAAGVVVLEAAVYGYKKFKARKTTRQQQAAIAMEAAQGIPGLAAAIEREAATPIVTVSTKAQEIAAILIDNDAATSISATNIQLALGDKALDKIKIGDIGTGRTTATNIEALKVFVNNHKTMPKSKEEAQAMSKTIIKKIIDKYRTIDPTISDDALRAVRQTTLNGLNNKLTTALTPNTPPQSLEHFEQLVKVVTTLNTHAKGISTAGGVTARVNIKKAIQAINQEVGSPLPKMHKAKIIKDIIPRALHTQLEAQAQTITTHGNGRGR